MIKSLTQGLSKSDLPADWQASDPPAMERLLISVTYPWPIRPKVHIGYYDDERQQWRWEGGAINGTVTHWRPLPEPVEG